MTHDEKCVQRKTEVVNWSWGGKKESPACWAEADTFGLRFTGNNSAAFFYFIPNYGSVRSREETRWDTYLKVDFRLSAGRRFTGNKKETPRWPRYSSIFSHYPSLLLHRGSCSWKPGFREVSPEPELCWQWKRCDYFWLRLAGAIKLADSQVWGQTNAAGATVWRLYGSVPGFWRFFYQCKTWWVHCGLMLPQDLRPFSGLHHGTQNIWISASWPNKTKQMKSSLWPAWDSDKTIMI